MKRIVYKPVTELNRFQKLITSPLFHDRDIITEDIVGLKMNKAVTLSRPVHIGQAVIDHSKLPMDTLFYDTLPCPLIHNIKLLGGDIHSSYSSL